MLMQAAKDYVALRRATGFRFRDPEHLLHSFATFAEKRNEQLIRSETAVEWAAQAPSQHRRYTRLRLLTRFALFLRAEDPRHEIPPQDVFCRRAVRPIPYLFSEHDIEGIVSCAAQLGPPGSLRPLTYSTMFGLMAVAGLRLGETLELRLGDFTGDALVIRETKYRKTRYLPLHDTSAAALERYLTVRRHIAAASDHFFVSLRHQRLSSHVVRGAFHQVCDRAGVGLTAAGTRPRLVDLRHHFAIRALQRCPAGRDQVNRHMLALTTYLGHGTVESTYWYLESTPELLRDIAAACERWAEGGRA